MWKIVGASKASVLYIYIDKVITCKTINVGVYVDMFDYILHMG